MIAHLYDILALPFVRYAIASLAVGSVVAGILGPFILMRRIGFIVGGISHALLGVVGIGILFGLSPFWMAILGAVFLSLLIAWIERRMGRGYSDFSIAVVWTLGMSLGILSLSRVRGYAPDIVSYLFGNVLLLRGKDVFFASIVAGILILVFGLFYRQMTLICVDEEFATAQGMRVRFFYYLLFTMIGLGIVVLLKAFGIILMISMLIIPSAIASLLVDRLSQVWLVSMAIALFASIGGFFVAYAMDFSVAPVVAILLSLIYLIVLIVKR